MHPSVIDYLNVLIDALVDVSYGDDVRKHILKRREKQGSTTVAELVVLVVVVVPKVAA